MNSTEREAYAATLSAAMRLIRKDRRMRSSEVARALGMPLRTYEHFEAGRGRISYDKIVRFADVTNCDPFAITAAIQLKRPEFALHCADNKLMTILMIAINELSEKLGEDIVFLEPSTLIGACMRLSKDLVDHVAKRDLFAENWLKEKGAKIQGHHAVAPGKWRRGGAE